MKITEKQAELIIERLINRIEQANTYYLKKIGSAIKQIRELTPTQAQQLVQILKYGEDYNDIVNKIAKFTELNVKDIDDIFKSYAKKDLDFSKQFYVYKNIPFEKYEENWALKRQTEALARIVKNEMYNFTRNNVIGYTIKDLDGVVRFKGLRETYNAVLDEALLNVGQGKETFDSAMSRIMKELGSSGLKTLEYSTGNKIRLDSAIRMHMNARLTELHNENQMLLGEKFGSDGIEISVHENPAPDHAPVQGRQFSTKKENGIRQSEWEKLQSGMTAKDSTGKKFTLDHDHKNGYRPIGEMNCYHYVFAVLLDANDKEYTEEQLQQIIDNSNEKINFEGKEYTKYECTQLQRRLERKIREQKDILTLAKESGNENLILSTKEKINRYVNKYRNLSYISNLPVKNKRLRAY